MRLPMAPANMAGRAAPDDQRDDSTPATIPPRSAVGPSSEPAMSAPSHHAQPPTSIPVPAPAHRPAKLRVADISTLLGGAVGSASRVAACPAKIVRSGAYSPARIHGPPGFRM